MRAYLRRERAAFIAKHSWVDLWIESNDNFFSELQSVLAVTPRSSIAERAVGAVTRAQIKSVLRLATTRGNTGGLLKRIDENRELLQYLQTKYPKFPLIAPAIVGIIKRNDRFYTELLALLDVAIQEQYAHHHPTLGRVCPRPWPLGV